MNEILAEKLNELNQRQDGSCWYIVKQETSFYKICYLTKILKDYKSSPQKVNLETYVKEKVDSLNETNPTLGLTKTHRALRIAGFYGLIDVKSDFASSNITDVYEEINARCEGEFELTDKYQDIIDRQIEKIYCISTLDDKPEIRGDFSIFPLIFLYKILYEIGVETGNYSISNKEFKYIVATEKKYDNYLQTLFLIKLSRRDNEFINSCSSLRDKYDNRMNLALLQSSCLEIIDDNIRIKNEYINLIKNKILDYEKSEYRNYVYNDASYIKLLCSNASITSAGCGNNFEYDYEYVQAARKLQEQYTKINPDAALHNLFVENYCLDKLTNIKNDEELLHVMFSNKNVSKSVQSLKYFLENDEQSNNNYGACSIRSSNDFILYFSETENKWKYDGETVDLKTAQGVARHIITEIDKAAKIIKNHKVEKPNDCISLNNALKNNVDEKVLNKSWVHKYLHIECQNQLSWYHTLEWNKHVLYSLGITPIGDELFQISSQINLIRKYAKINWLEFSNSFSICFDVEPVSFYILDINSGFSPSFRSQIKYGFIGMMIGGINESLNQKQYKNTTGKLNAREIIQKFNLSSSEEKLFDLTKKLFDISLDKNPVIFVRSGNSLLYILHNNQGYEYSDYSLINHYINIECSYIKECFVDNASKFINLKRIDGGNLIKCYQTYYKNKRNKMRSISPKLRNYEKHFCDWLEKNAAISKGSAKQYESRIRETATLENLFLNPTILSVDTVLDKYEKLEDLKKNLDKTHKTALKTYKKYLLEVIKMPNYNPTLLLTDEAKKFSKNRIVFGAPGTGKSWQLNAESKELLKDKTDRLERVTFHPDYSYTSFVGCYKPVMNDNQIEYRYVPGPFLRTLVKSLKAGQKDEIAERPYLLVIEEINRANVAAVFGDTFQLLDRDENGSSQYEITASEDIKNYLSEELGGTPDEYSSIKIPSNMYIWATMNSADQGVFPMDTAFKRRWNFEYLGINNKEDQIEKIGKIKLGKNHEEIEWNKLRKAINDKMTSLEFKINEDKLMGPFFLSKDVIKSNNDGEIEDPKKFIETFKSKVIMYLYEDAVRQKRYNFFDGCDDRSKYSSICDAFDEKGIEIFGSNFKENFYNKYTN